jgi:Male sterility protein/Phosphopantetheine attachment site
MGHSVDLVHCAPTLIENMYEHIEYTGGDFSPLVDLKLLQPGGASLSANLVKVLISKGVNVKTTYGSTEIGPPFRTIPDSRENPNCYTFRNLYPDSPFLKMQEVGEGLFELAVYKGFELAADLWDGKDDTVPYMTGDLFIESPPESGFFTLQGRRDDLIIHSNGENTNALPLQIDIQSSTKIINKAIALGHSKPCVCLLVEVHEEYDPASSSTRKQIWEAVQQVNEQYPVHSRILQSMIYILPEGNKLPVTPKGNVKRKEAERSYSSEIEMLYSGDDFSSSISEPQEPLSEYLRKLLSNLVNVPADSITDWTTLYSLGVTSHLALSLRSSLSAHLNRQVSLGTLFENPSISKLIAALTPPQTPTLSVHSSLDTEPTSTQTVNCIIDNLSKEFTCWPKRDLTQASPKAENETILLTGASGSLGNSLLATLAASPRISKIYAMVRGPNNGEKLWTSFEERGWNPSILKTGKIQVLNFSMQDPLLGLDIDTYYMLAMTVTTVVHNAWKMDFNQSIEEFEGDCLRSKSL